MRQATGFVGRLPRINVSQEFLSCATEPFFVEVGSGKLVTSKYSRASSFANETTSGTDSLPASQRRRSASVPKPSLSVTAHVLRKRVPAGVRNRKTDAADLPMWTDSYRAPSTNDRIAGGTSKCAYD